MSEPIRIIHCLIGNMNCGGIESFIMNVYRNINRDLVQFDFIIHDSKENYYEKEIIMLGGKIYRVPYKSKNFLSYYKEMTNLIKQHPEYKIMHIHTTYSLSYFDAKLAKDNGVDTIIIHSHNNNANFKRKILHYIFKRKFDNISTYRFACSHSAAKWMFKKNTILNNKYYVVNNGIDIEKFFYDERIRNKIRKKYNIENKFVIGNVGRLSYQKNPEFLIDIFFNIYKNKKSSVLLIVGNGELMQKLKNKVKLLGIEDKVLFLGETNDVDLILQAMDVFLLPSRYEGLGMVLVEAQSNGLKCYTSNNVPTEVNLTGLVDFIDLNNSSSKWADIILSKNNNRKIDIEKIREKGYDIKDVARFLQSFYIQEFIRKGE